MAARCGRGCRLSALNNTLARIHFCPPLSRVDNEQKGQHALSCCPLAFEDCHERVCLLKLHLYQIIHMDCRVAAKDSGKPVVDAAFGEVMVTCEKIAWLLREGERYLRPEHRAAGSLVRVHHLIIGCP